MAAIVWSDVTAFATSLSVATAAQTDILAHVNTVLDVENQFDGEDGPMTRLARIYLAAHLGTVGATSGSAGAAGPVIEREVGGVRERFAAASAISGVSGLDATAWGKLYRGLILASPARVTVVL